MKLELSKIRTDGGTQSRAILQRNIINEYAELMVSDVEMPPIDVFHDGENYWLVDGFHRLWAKKQISENIEDSFLPEETIEVTVHQGTQRDAILFSLGANNDHGIRRTNDDKNRAVETMIRDNEWTNWSDREIAKICKVSNTFVAKCREKINGSTVNVDSKKNYKRDGKVQTMKTENIGKHKITKEKEVVDKETGEIIIKSEKTLVVQAELEKCSNSKEMFDSEQFKEAVKKELENSHPELAERFDQDVELPSYNVISEELFLKKEFIKGQAEKIAELEKLLDLSDKFYKQAEYSESKTREELAKVEQELIQVKDVKEQLQYLMSIATHQAAKLIGLNQEIITWENVLDKLKEIMKLTNKVSEITEANNQLFVANENLTKELNEIKQKNVDLENEFANIKDALGLENESLDEVYKEISVLRDNSTKFMSINAAIERASLRLGLDKSINENQNKSEYFFQRYRNLWKENVDNAIKVGSLENEIKEIKEANSKLPNKSDEMLANIQSILEVSLEKGKEKREGIRIGRTASNELLNAIKQARGVE